MADTKPDATTIDAATGGVASSPAGPAGPKAIIKNVDMSEELQHESVDIASAALEKYNIEKDIAAHIKKEFDRRHGVTWHVVVGKNFGSYVTHGMYSFLTSKTRLEISSRVFLRPRPVSDLIYANRNQTFHLLLHRITCDPHLEIIDSALPITHFPTPPVHGGKSHFED
jgi:dynein light chain LC8-type